MPITQKYGYDVVSCPPEVGKILEAFPCAVRFGQVRRVLILNASAANPFTTLALLQLQATWTALLALDTADAPDNALFTPNITGFEIPAVEATTEISNNGRALDSGFAPSVATWDLSDLSTSDENQLKVTVEKNKYAMKVLFITDKNTIIYRALSPAAPEFIPINLATMGAKNYIGKAPQKNVLTFTIDHEKMFQWYETPVNFDILGLNAV